VQSGLKRLRLFACLALLASPAVAQEPQQPFVPQSGQAGKDVVWVPTPAVTVEKMLDLAKVTSSDYVVDLGSGDGRNVIAAAKRGATAVGFEFNPQMVELSRAMALKEGVSDRATFVEGDMYKADISKATALILFLLPHNLEQLTPNFLALRPGTRIVDNTFAIPNWEPDVTEKAEGDCGSWCTTLMWIVPAKVAGTWRLDEGEVTFTQEFQKVAGRLPGGVVIEEGRLLGDRLTFTAGGTQYTGRVEGDTIAGTAKTGSSERPWRATKR
jgi:SAM-dependent methyltransferase